MKYVFAIIKFQSLEYIKALQAGKLYMNHVHFFKNIEEKHVRKDIYEGLDKCFQPSQSKLIIGDHEIKSDHIVSPILCEKFIPEFTNIFCFFAVTTDLITDKNIINIDERLYDFGDYFLIPTDTAEFFYRIESEIKRKQEIVKCRGDLVEYVNKDDYHGDMRIFRKFSVFEYQNEYRIAIKTEHKEKKPYILDIGDISDISTVGKTSELEGRLKVMPR